MEKSLRVLLIEDDEEHARIISRHIRRADSTSLINLIREESLKDGVSRLSDGGFDAILLDLRLPDSDIHQTLPRMVRASAEIPIVVLSTLEDRDLAIQMIHGGAQDYLCKADLSSELLMRAIYSAMERKQAEVRLRAQVEQKEALFDLGQRAISEPDIGSLIKRAIALMAKTLDGEIVGLFELSPDRSSFLLKDGLGWDPGVVGIARIPADFTTMTGFTILSSRPAVPDDIKSHEPVIVTDLKNDVRFSNPRHLLDNGVTSGMSVVIYGKDQLNPHGVLGIFSRIPRIFSREDADFLQAVANTLAAAFLRLRLEEELKGRIRELDVAHRRKDEFLATLSHELRTPLNVITGYVELLKTVERNSSDFEEALEAVERNARIEAQLVADTLDLSRIITGKMKLQVSSFSLNAVIESAIDSIRFSAQAKGLCIEKKLAADDRLFVGDEGKIRQVIWNLLANAVKFTSAGGSVVIESRRADKGVEVVVRDTGKGISAESLPHVFERFWQEDAGLNRRYMGLGLGLAIVRHIVELHGGTAEVMSDGKDRGATFVLKLPILQSVTTVEGPVGAVPVLKSTPGPGGGLAGFRILTIDDSPDSLMIVTKLLQKAGAEVVPHSSPVEGLAAAQTGRFDIVVSDIGMPEMDGHELMRRLREWESSNRKKRVPAIALTAHVADPDVRKALDSGYQVHLPKPINIKDVESAIRRLLVS